MTFVTVTMLPISTGASSWNPTLLVNTESFNIIDEGDNSSDVYIQFGDSLAETLSFNRGSNSFDFSNSIHVDGSATVTGTISGSTLSAAGGSVSVSANGTTIINEFGNTSNFRVESDDEENLIFGHGILDRVGIGTSSPDATLDVMGTMSGENLHVSNRVTSSIVPDADLTYDLGLPNLRWNSLSASGITISGSVSGASLTVTSDVNSDLIPSQDLTYNLGSPSNRWDTLYADNIILSSGTEDEATFLNVGNRGGVVANFKNDEPGAGITIVTGAVVQVDSGSGNSVLLTESKNDQPIGVAVNASGQDEIVVVLFLGKINVQCTGTIDPGDLVQTSNVTGHVQEGGNSTKVVGSALSSCTGGFVDVLVHLE